MKLSIARTAAQLRLIRQASSGPEDSADTWRRRLEEWMDSQKPKPGDVINWHHVMALFTKAYELPRVAMKL